MLGSCGNGRKEWSVCVCLPACVCGRLKFPVVLKVVYSEPGTQNYPLGMRKDCHSHHTSLSHSIITSRSLAMHNLTNNFASVWPRSDLICVVILKLCCVFV